MSAAMRKVSSLVSSQWLAGQLTKPSEGLRVLDGSFHLPFMKRNALQEFRTGHIPGAQFFDIDACSDKSSEFDHMLPPKDVFEEYAGNLGIDNDTHVVVYDNNETFGLFSAQRVWWTFRVYGHDLVSVLDGGLPAWKLDEFETTDEIDKVTSKVFKAQPRNDALIKTYDQMLANVTNECAEFPIVDARPAGRFEGTAPEPRAGEI
jgi:thiosulfate/3-mercaptopyruvate sulfurtransferase